MRVALCLEGGGMRGVYTAGVLDFFLENNIHLNNIYAVSAGVLNSISYISRQKERSFDIMYNYSNDKRYVSFKNYLKTGSFFDFNFILNDLSDKLKPLDYETFYNNNNKLIATISNIETLKPEYKEIKDLKKDQINIIASSSLPLISKIVTINGNKYLDGGLFDSIPYKKALNDGYDKIVVITTRDRTYRKKRQNNLLVSLQYHKYKGFKEKIKNRYIYYNETIHNLHKDEANGKVFVISPTEKVVFKRFEKNKNKLLWLYNLGYNNAKNIIDGLKDYLKE